MLSALFTAMAEVLLVPHGSTVIIGFGNRNPFYSDYLSAIIMYATLVHCDVYYGPINGWP